jgi:hypothetical protein
MPQEPTAEERDVMVTPTIPTARVTGAGVAAHGCRYGIGGEGNPADARGLFDLPGGAVPQGGGSGT